MKLNASISLLLLTLALLQVAPAQQTQNFNGVIQHVVVVIVRTALLTICSTKTHEEKDFTENLS